MPRRTAPLLIAALTLLVGCSAEAGDPESAPTGASPGRPPDSASTSPSAPQPTTAPPATQTPAPASTLPPVTDPVSLPALMRQKYDGRNLRLLQVTARTDAYTTHYVTYRSGDLTISGLLNVPSGKGPFPALVLAHGYIDPDVYVNGQGLRREQDRLAREGFVTLHVDYRNHAGSSADPRSDIRLRLGYTEDVISAVQALRRGPRFVDDDRIGLVGRSMGGGVVYNVLTVRPGLVDAAVVFAPVSSDAADNFERWIRPDPSRSGIAREILRRHGAPEDAPAFWRGVSPRTYFDRVTEPVLIHHGTSDDSCPLPWSRQTTRAMERSGVNVTLRVYDGEEHAFGPQWPLSMDRTVAFLRRHLRA